LGEGGFEKKDEICVSKKTQQGVNCCLFYTLFLKASCGYKCFIAPGAKNRNGRPKKGKRWVSYGYYGLSNDDEADVKR